MNQEQMFEEQMPPPRQRSCLVKILAFLVILAFTVYSFSGLFNIYPNKAGFLQQNKALQGDELVSRAKPAVVYIESVDTSQPIHVAIHQATGFNIDPSGVIVTNRHVVKNASVIIISFASGQRFFSRQYTEIPGQDLVIIRLGGHDLPYLDLEQAEKVERGDVVTVIGNPMGFAQVAQRGQIGAFRRSSANRSQVFAVLMPIAKGSSGSPVINSQGRVVGVIFASSGSTGDGLAQGEGLAIPVDVLMSTDMAS